MYVRRNIRFAIIWRFAWKNLLVFTALAVLAVGGYLGLRTTGVDIRLPFLPLSTIGIAVAFYLGFKNSQSYDRFWEARKTWGNILNQGRAWVSQVVAFLPDPDLRRELAYRQLAWANALRQQLRQTSIHQLERISRSPDAAAPGQPAEPDTSQFLAPAELAEVQRLANPAAQLLHRQTLAVQRLTESGQLDEFRGMELRQLVRDCYALQGACERIKNTPFPRQYAFFSMAFTWIFVVLLPFGLVGEFSKLGDGGAVWLTVPFSVLLSWIFTTIEIVGDNSEDPFENYINDVPMTALCRSLEIDVRQVLGETQVPARLQPVNDILL